MRRLRFAGIILPLLFVVLVYAMTEEEVEDAVGSAYGHLVVSALVGALIVAFAIAMFALINRAQRHIVRQNRELAAVNGVSAAVQGELSTDAIIDAALHSVVASTGAIEASVTTFDSPGGAGDGGRATQRIVAAAGPGVDPGHGPPSLVDIPLSSGSAVVGRLRMRIPAQSQAKDPLSSGALLNIGSQLACAIQTSELVASLQRKRREAAALYELALQVTSQYALADILGSTVHHARNLLAADDGVLCLSEPISRSMRFEIAHGGLPVAADGTVCISPEPGLENQRHGNQAVCPVRSSLVYPTTLEAPLRTPAGSLGDLWVGRAGGPPFSESDAELLAALADLAAIAVTSARSRAVERESAVLAERERIAREMHDSLAQVLGTTHLRLLHLAGGADLGSSSPRVVAELTDLADLADEAYRDVRETILGLRESSKAGRHLVPSLEAYVEKYSRQSGVRTSLHAPADEELNLAPGAEIQVIRVIQEALANVRKHASANVATVSIRHEADGAVIISVEDNGKGFDLGNTVLSGDGSFGLHTMRERMELIGGTLSIHSAPGKGTRVLARVPPGAGWVTPGQVEARLGIDAPPSDDV